MATKEVDLVDQVPLVLFPVFAALALGAIALEFSLFGGFSFSQVIFQGSGVEISVAGIIATAAAVMIVATNELLNPDGFSDDMEKYAYLFGVGVIFGSVPLFMLMPAVRDLVSSYDVLNAVLFLAQSAAAAFVAWYR